MIELKDIRLPLDGELKAACAKKLRIPAKDDGESWDRLVAEIREIVPRGQEDIFINLVNRYIEMLEAQSN